MGKAIKENMSGEERLPDTLTPKDGDVPSQPGTGPAQLPWGRLVACTQFLDFLKSVDLIDSFSLGRSDQCSVVITAQACPENVLLNVSKVHFQIEKNSASDFVYITDLSKNGTFINRMKLGRGNRKILSNDDTIAIAGPRNSVFVFRSYQVIEDFLPAELIPKYINIGPLGKGSCGEVRLVRNRDTFNEYAVKKIILGKSNTSQIHKINHPTKIINEITILRSLSHPCVIRCEEAVQCEREIYLILEYMAGGELTRRVLDSPMNEDTVKFYFLQLLHAVQYLHFNRVIHRDLKPENILLLDHRQETVLKITDFGLSKVTIDSDMTTLCGTMKFVAPEVLHNSFREYGEYGKKVDVWSLGVILFFMMSRDYPFSGENNAVLANNIIKCAPNMTGDSWSKVSPELKDVIQKILVVQPKRRANIFQIINHPWIKNDYGVRSRIDNLLEQEGLVREPPEKKFKFDNDLCSSSNSGELDNTLVYDSEPTLCY